MDIKTMLHFWLVITIVLALGHLVNSYLWHKVIVKIFKLQQKTRDLEAVNKMYESLR